jgi:DNA-binding transcriptional MerR regulator
VKVFVGGKILAILKTTRDDKMTIKEISKLLDKNEDVLVKSSKNTTHSLHDCLSLLNAHLKLLLLEVKIISIFNCPSKEELEVPI